MFHFLVQKGAIALNLLSMVHLIGIFKAYSNLVLKSPWYSSSSSGYLLGLSRQAQFHFLISNKPFACNIILTLLKSDICWGYNVHILRISCFYGMSRPCFYVI